MSKYLASQRKDAHLDLAKQTLADRARTTHPLDSIELPYCALPELDLPQIDITARFLGYQLAAPMLITGMRRNRSGRQAECSTCFGGGPA